MLSNKLLVLSGCSGGGKSTLLTELGNNGYTIMPEVGREIVKEQIKNNGNIFPWNEPILFCELLIEKSIERFHKAAELEGVKDNIIFFDRSFLEGVSYYQSLKLPDNNKFDYIVKKLRYDSPIFMTPPWEEIFCEDEERKNTFGKAIEEYDRLIESFSRYGYELVILPKLSVNERLRFIVDELLKRVLF